MTAPHQVPAGWYPDPQMADTQRYWDGAQWSDQRRPMVDSPVVDASFAPTPRQPPAAAVPVPIREATKRIAWGSAVILALIALGILGFLSLISADYVGAAFDDEFDTTIDAGPFGADYRFGEASLVLMLSDSGDEDLWDINIGAPVDVTASVLDDNPAAPTLDGLGYIAFDIEAGLVETSDLTGAFFDMVVIGGATGNEYWEAASTTSCGQSLEQFVRQLPVERETSLIGKICVPVRIEDIGHPETRVELMTATDRAVFRTRFG